MYIFITLVVIAGIVIYLRNKNDKSTGKSAPAVDIKPVTDPVTPSMANPTADPAKEVVTPSMANPTPVAPATTTPTTTATTAKKTSTRRRKKKTV